MSINYYFSKEYLIKFGYFDFKPQKNKDNDKLLDCNKYNHYLINSTFYNKVFNCDDLSNNITEILNRSNFNVKKDTVPIEFSIYKTENSRRLYKMSNMYSYISLSLHLNENKNTYIKILNSSEKSLSKSFYNKTFLANKIIKDNNRFGIKYIFETDIQEFYPSIYTHSIPWIIAGKEEAKKHKNDDKKYYNELDKSIQRCQHGETHGLPIGSFTSRLISEIYLCKLDEKLDKYNYLRYVDDFELPYNFENEKTEFYNDLTNELKKLNLKLNVVKNETKHFPFSIDTSISNIKYFFYENNIKSLKLKEQANRIHKLIDIALNEEYNNKNKGSLKLLFQTIITSVKKELIEKESIYYSVKNRLINLILINPILVNYFLELVIIIDDDNFKKNIINFIKNKYNIISKNIKEYIRLGYSQELYSILSLFYLLNIEILEEYILIDIIKKMDDFNSVLAIQLYKRLNKQNWENLFNSIEIKLKSSKKWEDHHWLLKYEIFYEIKTKKNNIFTKEYKNYLFSKYGEGGKSKFFNEKNLKNIDSNMVFEVQNKNSDCHVSNFYKILIERKISFLNRDIEEYSIIE